MRAVISLRSASSSTGVGSGTRRKRGRRDLRSPATVRREHAVIARQVHARFRHEGGETCDEIQRCEDHVRRTVPVGPSQRLAELRNWIELQVLKRQPA